MGNYRYYLRPRLLTTDGMKECGSVIYDIGENPSPAAWWTPGGNLPWGYQYYAPLGIECKAAFLEAHNNPGLEVTLFRLTNGTRFYVTSVGGNSWPWEIWGSNGNNIYRIYLGQDFRADQAEYIYVALAYYISPSDVQYNTLYVAYKGPYGGNTMISSRFAENPTSTSVVNMWNVLLNGVPTEITDPYITLPESQPDGGFGNADYSNDDTDYSGLPSLSSSQVGFCSLYKMNQQQMADLADYLWGLSTGTIATFLPIFSNPMDCIIAVGIVPVEPEVESQQDLIKVGNLTTTVWGYRITKQYDEIDMGEVEIGKGMFTNSFMDYSPYTKVELYLPYIGNVSLDTDEVMDSTIGVKYKFDLLSGSCVAEVKVTKTYNYKNEDHVHSNILYRYSGNFLANIPVNGENFAQMFNAVIGAVAMGINAAGNYKTGIASADMAKSADVSSARSDAASLHRSAAAFNGVGATSAMKPSIQRAGNVSSVCGFLAKQKPEIVLKLPKIASIGDNQGHEVGYPRYGEYTIAELEGYSSIMMIHLKNIPCTDTERNMIENNLNSGVIFSKTAIPQHNEFQNTVKVYKFKCENICVNKADDWELIDTLTVAWRNPNIDVLNPTIRIEATSNLTKRKILKEGNYVYIADFERYYYVKSMKAQAGNFIELELSVDACMSWLTNLRNQRCVVDRQEKVWNTYLNDEFMRVYNTPYTVVKEFPNGFSTQNFILAVAGGGSTNSSSGGGGGGGGSF